MSRCLQCQKIDYYLRLNITLAKPIKPPKRRNLLKIYNNVTPKPPGPKYEY